MKKTFFILLFLLFLPKAFGLIVVNSQDWKISLLSLLYAKKLNEKIYLITSLGEADLASKMYRNENIIIIESLENPIVKNLKNFMELRGRKVEKVIHVSSPFLFQFEIEKELKPECYVVVPSKFSLDAISSFPYVLNKNCTLIFWSKEFKDLIISFLNSINKPIIFFGVFDERPWLFLKRNYTLLVFNDFFDANKKMVELLVNDFRKNNKRFWVVFIDGKTIEEGFLLEGMPIFIFDNNVEKSYEFLKKLNVSLIEAITPEMVTPASRIREKSNKTIGVVVKIGRTFTGIPELRGKTWMLKLQKTNYPIFDLKIKGVYYDKNSEKLIIVFENNGNIEVLFYLSSLRINVGEKSYLISDEKIYKIYPKLPFSIFYPLNFSVSNQSTIELLTIYGFRKPLKFQIKGMTGYPTYFSNISLISLKDLSSIELQDLYYDEGSKEIVIKILNNGSEKIFAYPQLFNIYYNNQNVTLAANKIIEIEPGKIEEIRIPIYFIKEELNKNKIINLEIFYGSNYPFTIKKLSYSFKLRIVKPGIITGLIILITKYKLIIAIVGVIILILLLFLFKKRKKK